ncbi:MAG: ATP-binding protein [Acidimicrobiia bacterium]
MQRYVPRMADEVLASMIRDHPAIAVTGPRASGKTTTAARHAATTIALGLPPTASAFAADPGTALSGRPEPVLVDEWQLVPDTLAAVKDLVDADPRPGRFLLTGSARADLDVATWPGTGRLVGLRMYGLTEREIDGRIGGPAWLTRVAAGDVPEPGPSPDDLRGYVGRALGSGFPEARLRQDGDGRIRWLTSYVDQLVTRDAIDAAPGRDPVRLRRFLEAFTINSGGVVDDATLFQAAGINRVTAQAYESLLAGLFVIDRLPAWTSNRLKRMVQSPKRFVVDPALFTGVLGVTVEDVLSDGDLLGRVLETWAVAQIRAEAETLVPRPRLHHLRTAGGRQEIDLVVEFGARRLCAIEIKATSNPTRQDARHLRWFRTEFGTAVTAAVLLHTGKHTFEIDEGVIATPLASLWS